MAKTAKKGYTGYDIAGAGMLVAGGTVAALGFLNNASFSPMGMSSTPMMIGGLGVAGLGAALWATGGKKLG